MVSCSDGGGPAELVEEDVSGLVVPPREAALADASEHLSGSPELAAELGEQGRHRAARITWESALKRLLNAAATGAAPT